MRLFCGSIDMTTDSHPQVSVIVAAYNSADFLNPCLESLERQRFRDFETIVVNSSAEDRTAAVVARFPGVRFFQSPERLFPHAARNVGVSLAKGDLLVFTDADCCADSNWLAELVTTHTDGHPVVGGCIDSSARSRISKGIYILKYSPYLRGNVAGRIEIAATGSMLVSRHAWNQAGPFDGSIFCGDALLSWKARQAGFMPWFSPTAIVTDQDEQYRAGFLLERLRRGKEFGRVRAGFEKWRPLHLFVRAVLAPVAVLGALARRANECRLGGRLADFVATLPFQIAAQAAWCFGESLGYWSLFMRGTADDQRG
jgi:glycosyltransferase involved in cell wall biosynthesis